MPLAAKVCGLTRREDALWAARCGASAVGFVFAPQSRRRASPELVAALADALPPFCWRIGVFADQPLDEVLGLAAAARLDGVQLHGEEEPAFVREVARQWPVWRALRAERPDLAAAMAASAAYTRAYLIDSGSGGTGRPFDWSLLANLPSARPIIVAGGLDGGNLSALCQVFRPAGVDASSRLEVAPGVKDPARVAAFLAAAAQVAASPE